MAKLDISGIPEAIKRFEEMGKRTEPALKKAVKAGGDLLAEKLRDQAPVRTGALKASIKASAVKSSSSEGYYTEVKPVGNHPKNGESLAKIGNILEYGRAKMAWFTPTVVNCENEVNAKIAEVFNKEMGR